MEQAGMGIGIGDLVTRALSISLKLTSRPILRPSTQTMAKGSFRTTLCAPALVSRPASSVGESASKTSTMMASRISSGSPAESTRNCRNRPDQPYAGPRILFRNLGRGRFEELGEECGPDLTALHCSRGCAFGDFDNDGDVDVLVINLNEPPSLLRNDVTGGGHWIKIKLQGVKSNRSAIGASVTVTHQAKSQTRAVLAQSSYLSVNDSRLHFGLGEGLGEATLVDIDIHWPSGEHEALKQVPADRLIYITEGRGIVRTSIFRT